MSSNNDVINVLNITRSHGKKFPKLSQTSFSGIVYYKNDQVLSLFYLDTLMRVTRGVTLILRNNNLVALLWDNFHLLKSFDKKLGKFQILDQVLLFRDRSWKIHCSG